LTQIRKSSTWPAPSIFTRNYSVNDRLAFTKARYVIDRSYCVLAVVVIGLCLLLSYFVSFGQPNINTRGLVVEEGGFKYDSDSYADDLPYWTLEHGSKPHLIVPYTLTTNDMRFVSSCNYGHGGDFCQLLKDNFK
jgi:hypothetical protein